ncbi:MAG: hypothetical protein F2704_00860 [Actinobacteria bacterium]|uniref:Unannotated protein n=1 Tax=freshwater metagenome TaxID=449393 RepID=A0A6J7D6T9_9ZZZZ|nr:hypothetical protein [Actinomycetota bacterium]MSX24792.1 hypothetical protein [Actinomycetota bacterium]MSY46198.1 hypothetical protein [Actinomycetota bacterium]MSY56800.1 hypothetical protein [Actinomycetota bacterium]MTB00475.1 hypothetical protein [Actinomycetota bacterium]
MKIRISLALLLILGVLSPQSAESAIKNVPVKAMVQITSLLPTDQVSGLLVKGKTLYLFGSSQGSVNNDGFIRAIDDAGTVIWSLTLDTGVDEIASSASLDSSGNIWVFGSAATAQGAPISASPTPGGLNPDGVVLDPEVTLRSDLTVLTAWKISPAGQLLATISRDMKSPILVQASVVTSPKLAVVGITTSAKGTIGFVSQSLDSQSFTEPLLVGVSDTSFNGVMRKSDGNLIVVGGSSETIAGKKSQGLRDGVIATISSSNKIIALVRSANQQSLRNWFSVSKTIFLGGDVTLAGKVQAVVTKFGNTLAPTWTTRLPSTGPALTINTSATSNAMVFSSTSTIPGISQWKASKGAVIALLFGANGAITQAFSATGLISPIGLAYSTDLGLVVLGSSATGVSIFHALTR